MKKRKIAGAGLGILASGMLAFGCTPAGEEPTTVYGPPESFEYDPADETEEIYGPPYTDDDSAEEDDSTEGAEDEASSTSAGQ